MEHIQEIKEIREFLNIGKAYNFATNIDAEELDTFPYLSKDVTGLPYDILIDENQEYVSYGHPLCIYVFNGPISNSETKLVAITVSDTPQIYNGPLYAGNEAQMIQFILGMKDALINVANRNISGGEFYEQLNNFLKKSSVANRVALEEMSTLSPKETGLDVWVYVDDTGSFMRSGHNGSYRFKFQQDHDISNPRQWTPVTVPDLVVRYSDAPPCKIPNKSVKKVVRWGSLNMKLLLALKNGKISGNYFKNNMKTLKGIKVMLANADNVNTYSKDSDGTLTTIQK